MGKINLKGVIIGGLVAGVVLNVVDFVLMGVVLKADFAAAMQALGKAPVPDSVIPWFVVVDLLLGIALVWVYAAIRPRFGAGPATAVKAGLIGWVLVCVFFALFWWPLGILPQNLLLIPTLVALVQQPLAVVVGAKFYTEM